MDFLDTPAEAAFRDEVRTWLSEHLVGEFAEIGGGGGPADETAWDLRVEWERELGKDRWVGLGWPESTADATRASPSRSSSTRSTQRRTRRPG